MKIDDIEKRNRMCYPLILLLIVGGLMLIPGCSPIQTTSTMSRVTVIPKPAFIEEREGIFHISTDFSIVLDSKNREVWEIGDLVAERFSTVMGFNIPISAMPKEGESIRGLILRLGSTDKSLGQEGYELEIQPRTITIEAEEPTGLFYGVQTLFQLYPPEVYSEITVAGADHWDLPCMKIRDLPRYRYRGMHLDVGRHFFPKTFIKRYLDLLALHKVNTFHWHLTEDQGWRIEIKKYPKLTEVGAYRKETLVGHFRDRPHQFDGRRYGGFYTQEDIREIIQYAEKRYITIIPEIEMPGHSLAAIASYPELSCTGGPFEVGTLWGVKQDVYCAGNDKVFEFLEDVLTEVIALFPSEYIHIGGDECPKDRWKVCPKCQNRIKQEGLKDEHELQSYFIKRIEKFLLSKGKRLIGWDEILEGGLAPEATVMSWRGTKGGIEAAKQGHDVIMTPTTHCYFDYYQADPETEPLAIGGNLTLKKVYSFEPTPEEFTPEEDKYILGAQGNVWTEYMRTPEYVEYMSVPRMCALAEVVWSPRERRSWKDFRVRLDSHFRRLDVLGVNYYKGAFD